MSKNATKTNQHDTGTGEQVIVTSSDVTIEKSPEMHRDDVAKISFTITSDTDRPVDLKIIDELPEEIQADSVGFHPEYHPDNWRLVDDQTVAFESIIDPEEEMQTLYGVKVPSPDELALFLDEPTVECWPKVAGGVEEDGEQSDDGWADSPTVEPVESLSLPEADDLPRHTPSVPDLPHSLVVNDTLVDALLAELEDGGLREEDREILAEHVDVDFPNSIGVRIRHIQDNIDDLIAYRNALEEFIDENGSAEAVIEQLEASVEDVRDEFDEVQAELAEVSDDVDTAMSNLDRQFELEEAVEANTDELSTVSESIALVRDEYCDRLDELSEEFDGLESSVENSIDQLTVELQEVRATLDQEREWRENLQSAMGMDPASFDYT